MAVAGKIEFAAGIFIFCGQADIDSAHGFGRGGSAGAGNSGNAQAKVGPAFLPDV